MPHCECGSFVTAEWKRVYKDEEDGRVRMCPDCTDQSERLG